MVITIYYGSLSDKTEKTMNLYVETEEGEENESLSDVKAG